MPLDLSHIPESHPALPNLKAFLEECDALGVEWGVVEDWGRFIQVRKGRYEQGIDVTASCVERCDYDFGWLSDSHTCGALRVADDRDLNPVLALRHVEAMLAEAGMVRLATDPMYGEWRWPEGTVHQPVVRTFIAPDGAVRVSLTTTTITAPTLATMRAAVEKLKADRALEQAIRKQEEVGGG